MRAVRLALAICASITTILTALACSAAEQSDDELDSLYRQARELVRARKFDEAIPITEQALALAEGRSGPDHPEVRVWLDRVAGLYEMEGRHAEAEALLRRSLTIAEKTLGPNHPDVRATLNTLALNYRWQGRYTDSQLLYERSLAI